MLNMGISGRYIYVKGVARDNHVMNQAVDANISLRSWCMLFGTMSTITPGGVA